MINARMFYVKRTKTMQHKDIEIRLMEFIESEARSCSMESGCITPEYVFRMWGGRVPLKEIDVAMKRF